MADKHAHAKKLANYVSIDVSISSSSNDDTSDVT